MISRRRIWGPRVAGILAALAIGLTAGAARAHISKDTDWHPVAKAYLFWIFATDLRPIDWSGITRRISSTHYPDQGGKSVYDMLVAVKVRGNDGLAGVPRAIKDQDRDALRAGSTRALAQRVSFHLARATRAYPTRAAMAVRHVDEARRLFRGYSSFIRQADPDGFRDLGLAWLELATMAGKARASKTPTSKSDQAVFEKTARVIDRYVLDNYVRPADASLAVRGPIPARGKGRDPAWKPAPWLPPDANIGDQDPFPRLVLNFEQRGIDERDFFMAAYGDMLFDSPEIFGDPAKSLGIACSTCHNRGDVNRSLFIPGLSRYAGGIDVDSSHFNRRGNDMRFDPLDTPSLRGIRYTAPYGRDGRIASLREFTRGVIVGEFGGPEPTPFMLDALVAYMNEFDFLPAPYLDRNGRLNEHASAAAKRGEKIFFKQFAQMGGQSCASCHIPSANFVDGRRHDIGSASRSSGYARDIAFDTPTLLGAAHSAPYFHDGSLETLADVVKWFNARFELNLNAMQRMDLTAYLTAVGTGKEPYEKFDAENTRFKLGFGELTTFISTLDELIPARDAFHAQLLIRTVSGDMRADASALTDVRLAPKVYELADRLDGIGKAITGADWARAAKLWSDYKAAEKRYATKLD